MALSGDLNVNIYSFTVSPEEMIDNYVTYKVMSMLKKQLERLIGVFVTSGKNIFTVKEIEGNIELDTLYKKEKYTVKIDTSSKSNFTGSMLGNLKMEDHSVAHTLINVIVKEAFRQTHLRQIGKIPRFFDTERSQLIPGSDLQVWPGFRASAFNY